MADRAEIPCEHIPHEFVDVHVSFCEPGRSTHVQVCIDCPTVRIDVFDLARASLISRSYRYPKRVVGGRNPDDCPH